jgi:hypothetical protein
MALYTSNITLTTKPDETTKKLVLSDDIERILTALEVIK